MSKSKPRQRTPLTITTVIVQGLLACFFLIIGVSNLASPHVPHEAMTEDVVVSATLIMTGIILVYAVFRPYSGGILLFVSLVAVTLVFNAFNLSRILIPSRPVAYNHFWTGISILILVAAVLSVLSARPRRVDADR